MYSKTVLNLFANPVNAGRIMKPDGIASLSNLEGTANVEFSLRIENDLITACNFRAQANPYIVAICSTITKMVIGKSIDSVMLDQSVVKRNLGEDSDIDITFCIECLDLAIENYIEAREKEGKPKSTRGRKKKIVLDAETNNTTTEETADEETTEDNTDDLSDFGENFVVTRPEEGVLLDPGFAVDYKPEEKVEEQPKEDKPVEQPKQEQAENQPKKRGRPKKLVFEGGIFDNPLFADFFNKKED